MNKLQNFWRVFVKSIGSISYYKDIAKARFSFSLKYIYFLLFLIALLQGIISAVKLAYLMPKIPQFQQDARYQVLNFYPKELVITVKDQQISTNVKEPYFMGNFIVIDTKATVDKFASYKKPVLLTSSAVVIENGSDGYKVTTLDNFLKEVPNGSQFNQKMYLGLVNKLLPYLNYLPAFGYCLIALTLFVLPFIIAGSMLVGKMFILVFSSLLLLLLAKIMKRDLSYGKVYQLSLHALTIPVVLSFVSAYFVFPVGWLSTLIFLTYMIVVIASWEIKNNHTPGV